MAGKYIELVGVAGAGKTAIAKILDDEALRREVAISLRGVVGRNLRLRVQTLFAIAMIVVVARNTLPIPFACTQCICTHPTRQKNKT